MDTENNTTPDRDKPPQGFSSGVLKVPSFDFRSGDFQAEQQSLHETRALRSYGLVHIKKIPSRIRSYGLMTPEERDVFTLIFNSCKIQGIYLAGVLGLQRALRKEGDEVRELLYSMASKGLLLIQERKVRADSPPLLNICPCTHFSYLAASIDLCQSTHSAGSMALSESLKWMAKFQKISLTDAIVAIKKGVHPDAAYSKMDPICGSPDRAPMSDNIDHSKKIIDFTASPSQGPISPSCTPNSGVRGEEKGRTSGRGEEMANEQGPEGEHPGMQSIYNITQKREEEEEVFLREEIISILKRVPYQEEKTREEKTREEKRDLNNAREESLGEMKFEEFVRYSSQLVIGRVVALRDPETRRADWHGLWHLAARQKINLAEMEELANQWIKSYPEPRCRDSFGGTCKVMIDQIRSEGKVTRSVNWTQYAPHNIALGKYLDDFLGAGRLVACSLLSDKLVLQGKIGARPRKIHLRLDLNPVIFRDRVTDFLNYHKVPVKKLPKLDNEKYGRYSPQDYNSQVRQEALDGSAQNSREEKKLCLMESKKAGSLLVRKYASRLREIETNPKLMDLKLTEAHMILCYGLKNNVIVPLTDGANIIVREGEKWEKAFLQSQSLNSSSLASQSPGNALA